MRSLTFILLFAASICRGSIPPVFLSAQVAADSQKPVEEAGGAFASDNFDSYANGANLGGNGNWVRVSLSADNELKVNKPASDGEIYPSNGEGNGESCTRWNSGTWSANHYSSATLSAKGAGAPAIGVAVRCQSDSISYYALYVDNANGWYLIKNNNGTAATVSSGSVSWSAGWKLKLEVTGSGSATRLSGYRDSGGGWVALFTNTDPGGTYIDDGWPGVAGWSVGTNVRIDDWEAGDLE